ncbi:uncharacterized protein [Onthophagus taurus]|uniref:uncharacterized protein n=1 Tax=Onthophagus taurus TaxID=166361 RepID=UPI000C20E731|nr:uncharacterized protein LOC111417990 [Onthophagus taurus]
MENAHPEPNGVVPESPETHVKDMESTKDEDLEKLEELQSQLVTIYSEIEDFYKKMPLTVDRTQYVDNVISDIETIVCSLQNIASVDDANNIQEDKNLPSGDEKFPSNDKINPMEDQTESCEKQNKNVKNEEQQRWDQEHKA